MKFCITYFLTFTLMVIKSTVKITTTVISTQAKKLTAGKGENIYSMYNTIFRWLNKTKF